MSESSSGAAASGEHSLPFELSLISLDHLEVDRRGFLTEPGNYRWNTQYRLTEYNDVVLCLVINEVALLPPDAPMTNEDDDSPTGESSDGLEEDRAVASIHIAHMAVYTMLSEVDLSDDQREEIIGITRMSVHPLLRAQVLTSTAELGFPPLTLPLLRRGSMPPATELASVDEEDPEIDS